MLLLMCLIIAGLAQGQSLKKNLKQNAHGVFSGALQGGWHDNYKHTGPIQQNVNKL